MPKANKARDIQKPNKKQKQVCPFLKSSDQENNAEYDVSQEKIKPNWKNRPIKKDKQKSQYFNDIKELGKEDFRRFGLRVNWTEDEDAKLLKLRQQYNVGWAQMDQYFPGRTYQSCKMRYKKLENKTHRRWSNQERDLLIELVKENGQDWEAISEKIPNKTATQVKTYYLKTLPKRGWTAQENCKLIQCMKKYKDVDINKIWIMVALQFPGRQPQLIKEHYEITLGRIAKKKILKEKEDDENFELFDQA